MLSRLQEGIRYSSSIHIGNSFCILSLVASDTSRIKETGNAVGRIWNILTNLKKGIISDLKVDKNHLKTGNLSVLVGYGTKLFDIPGLYKKRPASFSDIWNFKIPSVSGGGPIFDGGDLMYSKSVFQNQLRNDHIIFQFIADSEFYTNRAVVEVWKELLKIEKEDGNAPLQITGVYSGFQREDHRNWLGFHDGISNLRKSERSFVIPISTRFLSAEDKWTQNGTYLGFIRIAINLNRWIETSVENQQLLIGRHKLTGCPLVVDRSGKPVKDSRCPVRGTSEVIDPGNEYFRDHRIYGSTVSNKLLQLSHVVSTNPNNRIPVSDRKSLRIYRQGFEFLVPSNDNQGFIVGLNFVSFQNSPERLFRALTYRPPGLGKTSKTETSLTLNQFMSVLTAGTFFVPPATRYEFFPGAEMFGRI